MIMKVKVSCHDDYVKVSCHDYERCHVMIMKVKVSCHDYEGEGVMS